MDGAIVPATVLKSSAPAGGVIEGRLTPFIRGWADVLSNMTVPAPNQPQHWAR